MRYRIFHRSYFYSRHSECSEGILHAEVWLNMRSIPLMEFSPTSVHCAFLNIRLGFYTCTDEILDISLIVFTHRTVPAVKFWCDVWVWWSCSHLVSNTAFLSCLSEVCQFLLRFIHFFHWWKNESKKSRLYVFFNAILIGKSGNKRNSSR